MQQKQLLKGLFSKVQSSGSVLRSFPQGIPSLRSIGSSSAKSEAKKSPLFPTTEAVRKHGPTQFFRVIQEYKKEIDISHIPPFLFDYSILKKAICDIETEANGNYLMEHFAKWLSFYAGQKSPYLREYFANKGYVDLSPVCKDFISFCFQNRIFLDASKTLASFSHHNQLSDTAVKEQLLSIQPKEQINILGFGLDDGAYEKTIVKYLTEKNLAKKVNLYGFDPYASKTPNIQYLSSAELNSPKIPQFDLVIARWVLHHVALQHRWRDFVECVNNCRKGAMVLVVEHGFLKEECTLLDKKLYNLLNATFDIVANIGLRPQYFTNSSVIGDDFFIGYLEPKDFQSIRSDIAIYTTSEFYEVGPGFPNQTIACMRVL
jgi:hypothetical protein